MYQGALQRKGLGEKIYFSARLTVQFVTKARSKGLKLLRTHWRDRCVCQSVDVGASLRHRARQGSVSLARLGDFIICPCLGVFSDRKQRSQPYLSFE
jgi:hypothetical protein